MSWINVIERGLEDIYAHSFLPTPWGFSMETQRSSEYVWKILESGGFLRVSRMGLGERGKSNYSVSQISIRVVSVSCLLPA